MYDFLRKWKKEKKFKIYINYPNFGGTFEVIDFSPFHRKVQIRPFPDGKGVLQTLSIDDLEIYALDIILK